MDFKNDFSTLCWTAALSSFVQLKMNKRHLIDNPFKTKMDLESDKCFCTKATGWLP